MNIMRTLVYRHIPMYCIHITYVWCGISTCSPSVAPVLAAVSAELVPGDSAGWRMRCVNNKIHNMIPRHPSPPSSSRRHNRISVEICAEIQRVRVQW